MDQPGDLIVYGNTGVCRVASIGPLDGARGADRDRRYYSLSMVNGSGSIFVPVDTSVFMRPILTRDEVDALINTLPELQGEICTERNLRLLSEQYHAAFQSHRCEDLLKLMKAVHAKGKSSGLQGKTLGMTDQRYQKKAEELIYGEFSVVLGIPYDQVERYIADRLDAGVLKAAGQDES